MKLGNIYVNSEEIAFLRRECPYLDKRGGDGKGTAYLEWLSTFRLKPREQVQMTFSPDEGSAKGDAQTGIVDVVISGLWVDTILYEIPLLALTSEAYFKFVDREWTYEGQERKAYEKGMQLLNAGCVVSEFGTRRRRDYHTQALVFGGLLRADADVKVEGEGKGRIQGTSNVHLAMRYNVPPIGTVAHEWFMGVAAINNSYETASEKALEYWVRAFGVGVLGIALTDTFGTPVFLEAFKKPIPEFVLKEVGYTDKQPITYAEAFTGVRQDSGDPAKFVQRLKTFYEGEGLATSDKLIVFSDSLNIQTCLKYKELAETAGFKPTFGVGTFFTNDFVDTKTGTKSEPLNIVVKLRSVGENWAVKISDDIGKNTGDVDTVKDVKERLGYQEGGKWGDEEHRWAPK